MTTDQPDPPGEWDCDAYGPGGRAAGALCFFARAGERKCPSAETCVEAMTGERQRVWQRIQDHAAAGDSFAADLAAMFPTPDTILGGGQAHGQAETQ
jgi:hypothetical protein